MVDIPQRGYFVWINFDPQTGHEQKGRRPGLVISHTIFNQKRGFAVCCPVSSTPRNNPFYVPITEGIEVSGVIMVDQVRSLDYKSRKSKLICECPDDIFKLVLRQIELVLF